MVPAVARHHPRQHRPRQVTRPLMLVSIMLSQSSSEPRAPAPGSASPALLTSTSMVCPRTERVASALSTATLSVTSSTSARAEGRVGGQRLQPVGAPPADDHPGAIPNEARAVAAPKPAVAPVIKTIIVCPCEIKKRWDKL